MRNSFYYGQTTGGTIHKYRAGSSKSIKTLRGGSKRSIFNRYFSSKARNKRYKAI